MRCAAVSILPLAFLTIRLPLDPRWAGGRPRRIRDDAIDVIVAAATTRPEKLGLPFTRWSLRKLAVYLADRDDLVRVGPERLRQILQARGISFQRTRTWKESADPDRDAKLDRIEYVTSRYPDRCFAFDQFGPLSIRPVHGASWAPRKRPVRLPATYHRTHGVRYFNGCYGCATGRPPDILRGGDRPRPTSGDPPQPGHPTEAKGGPPLGRGEALNRSNIPRLNSGTPRPVAGTE